MIREHRTVANTRRARVATLCVAILAVFVFTAIVYSPLTVLKTYAADYERWEDCDWDGYDDHTGVPVPWPGFDGTRGDTPSGPSPDSQTGKQKEQSEDSAGGGSSKTTDDTKKEKNIEKENSKKKDTKKNAEKDIKKKDQSEAAITEEKSVGETKDKKTDEKKEKKRTTEAAVATVSEPAVGIGEKAADEQSATDAAIVAQKGVLEAYEPEGSALHAGSAVIVRGAGFFADVAELTVEIHSDPIVLGTIVTDSDGAFESDFVLPEDLPSGNHEIVVLYKSAVITSIPVEVGPPLADNFFKALTAGFSPENGELPVGIVILVALAVLGFIALIAGSAVNRRKKITARLPISARR